MDINTSATTKSGNLHGMPLSMLIKGIPEVWKVSSQTHYLIHVIHQIKTKKVTTVNTWS